MSNMVHMKSFVILMTKLASRYSIDEILFHCLFALQKVTVHGPPEITKPYIAPDLCLMNTQRRVFTNGVRSINQFFG
jgi:hypothetical protein